MSTKKNGVKNQASGSNRFTMPVCCLSSLMVSPAMKAPTIAARPM